MYQKYVFMKLKIFTGLLTGLVVSVSTTALFCQPSRAGNNNFFCGTLPYISTGILNPEPVFNERILINTSVRLLASAQVDVGVKVSSASVPTDPKAEDFFIQGEEKYEKGDYQGAVAAYNEAIVLNPNYAEAYKNRGIARFYLGDKQGALADFNEARAN
jgi:tetratricopeptide (TPR) repeat protein